MKKLLCLNAIVCLVGLLCFNACSASKFAEVKEKEQERQKISAQLANSAIINRDFVLEADRVVSKSGRPDYTTPYTNFVMMQGDDVVIQLSLSSMSPGPNGVGGITIEGKTTEVKQSYTKKGNLLLDFKVMSPNGVYQANMELYENSDQGKVTIEAEFSGDYFTLIGKILRAEDSDIYKGAYSLSPKF